jgi:serine/threonine protein kinase
MPATDDRMLSPDELERVDRACDLFEQAWQSDQRPEFKSYMESLDTPAGKVMLRELLRVELAYRVQRGEQPAAEEYKALSPDHADLIGAAFDKAMDQLNRGEAPTTPPAPATDSFSGNQPTSARYHHVRFHAKGGLGEVYVAHDETLHREVALKRIRPERANDAESRRRFLVEAEVTGRLEHPGIVPVHDLVWDKAGQPCYTMRFVQGESLKEAIERFHEADKPGRDAGERSLALRQLLNRFIAVCNAVEYAHSRGILHRDIKPANILLGKYGETLLVDWGLAKHIERGEKVSAAAEHTLSPTSGGGEGGTQTGQALGTPAYMSPEQAGGRWSEVGPTSDVYSLGATLYSLLAGKLAFTEPDLVLMLAHVQSGGFPKPRAVKPSVPRALERVCLKAMSLRAEDRYPSAGALANEIEHWLADEPVSAWREPWSARLARFGRRHKPLAAGTAALMVAAIVALSLGIVVVNRERERTNAALALETELLVAQFNSNPRRPFGVPPKEAPVPLSATGVNFSATAGEVFSGTVATFRSTDNDRGPYMAFIDWGDGFKLGRGSVHGDWKGKDFTCTVSGSHLYADPGNRTVHVTISHTLGHTLTAMTDGTATVTAAGQRR